MQRLGIITVVVMALVAILAFGQCVDCLSLKALKPCCQKAHGKTCPMPMPMKSKGGDCPNPDGVLGSAKAQAPVSVDATFAVVDSAPAAVVAGVQTEAPHTLEVAFDSGPPDIYLQNRTLRI